MFKNWRALSVKAGLSVLILFDFFSVGIDNLYLKQTNIFVVFDNSKNISVKYPSVV